MPLPPPITSRTNARVKALRAAFQGKASHPGELVGLEGWKTVMQAAEAGLVLNTVALLENRADLGGCADLHARLHALPARDLLVLSPAVMASVADTLSPPEIVATIAIPSDDRPGPQSRLYLVLEDIQDPGNLGTLIRSAEAFGVERVFLSPGCANPWAPKVLRASAGSVLRQPLSRQPLGPVLHHLRAGLVHLLAAVAAERGAVTAQHARFATPVAILIGNEGSGLTPATLALAQEKVYIPCRTESLNAAVAGSLLLYEAERRSTPAPAVLAAHGARA